MVILMKKKTIITTLIIVILIIIGLVIYFLSNVKINLIKLKYNELIEKVENKESFVLCISATECSHCQEYKPKLKKIANNYDIKIYYIDIDKINDDDYETFKTRFSFDGSTPITIFFKEGEEKTTATRIEGNTKSEKVIEKLKNNGFIK